MKSSLQLGHETGPITLDLKVRKKESSEEGNQAKKNKAAVNLSFEILKLNI